MSSQLALKLVDQSSAKQKHSIESEAQHKWAIETFRREAGSLTTPADFVKNHDVYVLVMRAYDLEDQIFGKAMIRKILESDISDSRSLVNRMTDPRFRNLYKALNFGTSATGVPTSSLSQQVFRDSVVSKYISRVFINRQSKHNPAVGAVLDFREKIPEIRTWYDVLKDAGLSVFFRTALGLPESMSGLDVDKQVSIMQKKFDLTTLGDPSVADKLAGKYLLFSDLNDSSRLLVNNPVLQMFDLYGSGGGNFVIPTIDILPVMYPGTASYN